MTSMGTVERFCRWLAWRLPRKLVYWCAIRVGAYAVTGSYSDTEVPGLIFMDAIKRWGEEESK